jgi:hypothetical protein
MIKDNRDEIILTLRKKMKREITGQDLTDIASETVSTVEGGFGFGLVYEDVVDVICELLIDKFELVVVPEVDSVLLGLDKPQE